MLGHALMKMNEKKTWGIATKRGRVWAMKRGTLDEYKTWCDDVADLLTSSSDITTLPGLSFLASTSPINDLEEMPMAIMPDDAFFRASFLLITVQGDKTYQNEVPSIIPRAYEKATGDLFCILMIETFSCKLIMNFNNSLLWTVVSDKDVIVRMIKNENSITTATLENILNDLPPTLIMPKGYIVEGRTKIIPNNSIENLSSSIWLKKDWSNCLITAEKYVSKPKPNELPVINKVAEEIRPKFNDHTDVLVLDDGSHEIADLIWIQGLEHIIHYIHCKPSKTSKPGCRKSDCDVVFTQAMRSVHWVYSELMFERVNERLGGKSKIILGTRQTLDEIAKNFKVNDWSYIIVVAQPGFDISKVSDKSRTNNNVYELTIPTYERVLTGPANFEIWGS